MKHLKIANDEDWDDKRLGYRTIYKETSPRLEALKKKLPWWLRWII